MQIVCASTVRNFATLQDFFSRPRKAALHIISLVVDAVSIHCRRIWPGVQMALSYELQCAFRTEDAAHGCGH